MSKIGWGPFSSFTKEPEFTCVQYSLDNSLRSLLRNRHFPGRVKPVKGTICILALFLSIKLVFKYQLKLVQEIIESYYKMKL